MPQAVSLTDHEQQCLCHLNRAQEQGLSLKAYADAEGLRGAACTRPRAS